MKIKSAFVLCLSIILSLGVLINVSADTRTTKPDGSACSVVGATNVPTLPLATIGSPAWDIIRSENVPNRRVKYVECILAKGEECDDGSICYDYRSRYLRYPIQFQVIPEDKDEPEFMTVGCTDVNEELGCMDQFITCALDPNVVVCGDFNSVACCHVTDEDCEC